MSKAFNEYLPPKETRVLVQSRVPKSLVSEVKRLMKKDHLKWPQVMSACLTWFIEQKRDAPISDLNPRKKKKEL